MQRNSKVEDGRAIGIDLRKLHGHTHVVVIKSDEHARMQKQIRFMTIGVAIGIDLSPHGTDGRDGRDRLWVFRAGVP